MLAQVFSFLGQGINFVSSVFSDILESTEMTGIVIGVVLLLIFWRLIINPLFGGASIMSGSDKVSVTESTSIRGEVRPDGSVYYDPGNAVTTRTYTRRS